MNQELYLNSTTDYLELIIRDHNQTVIPESVSVTIYRDNRVILQDQEVVPSIAGIHYAPGLTITGRIGQNLRTEWRYTTGGLTRVRVLLFDVVRQKLESQLSDCDLIAECSPLQQAGYFQNGLAEAGSCAHVVDNQLLGAPLNMWKGGTIEFLSGLNTGQKRIITSSADGTITWAEQLPEPVAAGTVFTIERTFQQQIDQAWIEILAKIRGKGYRPALILSSDDFRIPHLYLALEKVCRGLANTPEDIWWERANLYHDAYNNTIENIDFQYDANEDSEPDSKGDVHLRFTR